MNKERRIRILFTTVLILLPLQYAWVGVMGVIQSEPWPALVFPGFKSVYSDGERFFVTKTDIVVAGQDHEEVLHPAELLSELPLSQLPGFMRTHFGSQLKVESLSREQREWLRQRAEITTGFKPETISIRQSRSWFSRPSDTASPDSVEILFEIQL